MVHAHGRPWKITGDADKALAEAGARVVIADLNPENGQQTASEVGAGFTRIDVSSSASVSEVVTDLISVHGAITSG